jgi:hypothetical protein
VIEVRLTPYELMLASSIGCMRHISAVKAGRQDKHGAALGAWQIHIEGALGEIALAKALGLFWSGSINTFKDADIGERFQVRTRSCHDYELIVRKGDSDNECFVLVTGIAPEYRVHGWIGGADAKRGQWLKEHGGREAAYFVPHNALRPIAELQPEGVASGR